MLLCLTVIFSNQPCLKVFRCLHILDRFSRQIYVYTLLLVPEAEFPKKLNKANFVLRLGYYIHHHRMALECS